MIPATTWQAMYVDLRRKLDDASNGRGTKLPATCSALVGLSETVNELYTRTVRGDPGVPECEDTIFAAYTNAVFLAAQLKGLSLAAKAGPENESIPMNVQYEQAYGIALGLRILIDRRDMPVPLRDDQSDPGA